MAALPETTATPAGEPPTVGSRLRELRQSRGLSARKLAALLDISPSAVSQIERGVLQPSVSRIIAITDALGVPLSTVFDDQADAADLHPEGFALKRSSERTHLVLDNGVSFRRISPADSPGVEYFESIYPPGSAAHDADGLFHHEGYEVGTVLSGELTIDFTDERVVLRPGDTVSYPCSRPHRLHNDGAEPVVAQWLIVHPPR